MVVVSSLGPPDEGIIHKEVATTTFINEKPLGKGTLYISEARVTWVGDAGHTFSLEYNHIALHAVSRYTLIFVALSRKKSFNSGKEKTLCLPALSLRATRALLRATRVYHLLCCY
jgi:hypothetical protein